MTQHKSSENIEITYKGDNVEDAEKFIRQLENLGYEVEIKPLPEPEQPDPNQQQQT